MAFRGAAGVGRRRLRGRSSAATAVAAHAKDRYSMNRRRRRRLFKPFVIQEVMTDAVLSPGQQLIIDSAPSNRSTEKPQPTPRHCRLTGLNHALTYSNLAPISWRSEKLRRSPCTGHQVSKKSWLGRWRSWLAGKLADGLTSWRAGSFFFLLICKKGWLNRTKS